MAIEIFYSALHWAKKAEKSATRAQTAASQAEQSSGKIIQLGFDGAMQDGKLVFKHAPSGVEFPYSLSDDYEYELDLSYTGADLSSLTEMYVKNGSDTIRFVSALHRSSTDNARVADMDAVMRYDTTTGYRWLFKATFKIAPNGAKVFLLYPVVAAKDYSDKTNCITEIPQDIKLELNDGTVTLKAGSKVYVPNGFEADGVTPKFDVVIIESDVVRSFSAGVDGSFLIFKRFGDYTNIDFRHISFCVSGASDTNTRGETYYSTSTNIITSHNTDRDVQVSLPLALISISNGAVSSIDQVFNGFGYIGSTVFALPGVKGLIPDGRNADGSLNNKDFVTNNVIVSAAYNGNWSGQTYFNGIEFIYTNTTIYNKELNILIDSDGFIGENSYCCIGNHVVNSDKVTLYSKLPFHAVDRNDSSWIAQQAMPSGKYIDLTLGASGSSYIAPANGYFMFGKRCSANNQYLGTYGDSLYSRQETWGQNGNYCSTGIIPVKKGQSVKVTYNADGSDDFARFIYAEGEN